MCECCVTGALVILALGLLTPLFYYIPNAGLAGVIIMAVLDMADFHLIKKLWQVKSRCHNVDFLLPSIDFFYNSLIYNLELQLLTFPFRN